jgi:hypothetical protein
LFPPPPCHKKKKKKEKEPGWHGRAASFIPIPAEKMKEARGGMGASWWRCETFRGFAHLWWKMLAASLVCTIFLYLGMYIGLVGSSEKKEMLTAHRGYLKGFSCPASFSVDPIPLASHCPFSEDRRTCDSPSC